MKIKAFVIAQREYAKKIGFKAPSLAHNCGLFFNTEEDARAWLADVILNVKDDIQHGRRMSDALDPIKGLDFCITECGIDIPEDKMLKRGWVIEGNI